jgi:thimet oligopeptidase
MKKVVLLLFLFNFLLFFIYDAVAMVDYIKYPQIWKTKEVIEEGCKTYIKNADELLKKILEVNKPTVENTLVPYNEILIYLNRAGLAYLFSEVHPDVDVRDAAELCVQDINKFATDLSLNREVYDRLKNINKNNLDYETLRFIDKTLLDFELSGVNKDDQTRQELADLSAKMVLAGQEFDRNIREDKRSIEVTLEDLKGLPQDYIDSHKADESGKIIITTDYPDADPVKKYADKEETRKKIFIEDMNRAYPSNDDVLKKLLILRHQYATLLGYETYADYSAEKNMLKPGSVIGEFIDNVVYIAEPRADADLKQLLARKRMDNPQADAIHIWDRVYYVNKIRSEDYKIDFQALRSYFEYNNVKTGILKMLEDFFDIQFKNVKGDTWYKDVEIYDVLKNGETFGRIYLDMHPREGKYSHNATFSMITGVDGYQLPSGSLVCNFPDPSKSNDPVLMEFDDVSTFFHEMGHLVHHILAYRHKWISLSGLSCEDDFVEIPSQLLEEFACYPDILQKFAKHIQTGEPIPADLVNLLKKSDSVGRGADYVMQQMFYAALSYKYHSIDPTNVDLLDTMKKLQAQYSVYPYEEGTYFYASFGHLEGYASRYYTYMYDLVIVKDLFSVFEKNGIMDKNTWQKYTINIIEPGGSIPGTVMIRNFLGRKYSFEPFRIWVEE